MTYNILCLSHLAWQATLFQRPQQLMLRMARRGHRVVYAGCVGLKASLQGGSSGRVETGAGAPPLRFLHLPCAPTARTGTALRSWYAVRRLCRETVHFEKERTVLWLYHPALLPLGRAVLPQAPVVYDVMDRFTAFAASPEVVAEQEEQALKAACAVFTGGRSIDRAIRSVLPADGSKETHCFPSGIDLAHFGRARDGETVVPADVASFPRPVFGYFGAVDERVDFDLLAALAAARLDASVVVVGPVLGNPGRAPLPPNLHLLGGRRYEELPAYLKAFDVCLLPFRNTPLVAHVSPTKTPEYLAGGCPVVSTPIPDVVADYGDVVRIAGDRAAFLHACSELANNPPEASLLQQEAHRRARTWDRIADEMDAIVTQSL